MDSIVGAEVSSAGRIRAVALATFALMVVVTLASAFLRLGEAAGLAGVAVDLARGAHRVAASAALVLAVGIALFGWDGLRPPGAARGAVVALVALGVGLAILGRYTPSTHPFVAFANPLGGLAMAGLAWWLWLPAPAQAGRTRSASLGVALVAVAFGAVAVMVLWPPALAAGLAVQLVATGALAAGVSALHRGVRR